MCLLFFFFFFAFSATNEIVEYRNKFLFFRKIELYDL